MASTVTGRSVLDPPIVKERALELELEGKIEGLEQRLRAFGSTLVCYSGGVDSAFLLAMATRVLGDRAVGMTAVSPSLAPRERDAADTVRRGKASQAPLAALRPSVRGVRRLPSFLTTMGRAAMACRAGGVGKYSRSDFVHMDCGAVRSWGG